MFIQQRAGITSCFYFLSLRSIEAHRDAPFLSLSFSGSMNSSEATLLENIESVHNGGVLHMDNLRVLIECCRKLSPKLTDEACGILKQAYLKMRQHTMTIEDATHSNHVPVTVRQLEALIRISESLAKLRFSESVCKVDAERAVLLLEQSTMSEQSASILG